MRSELDWISLYLIETHLDLKERYKQSEKNLHKLIRQKFKEGVSAKLLAYHTGFSQTKIRQIIHTK